MGYFSRHQILIANITICLTALTVMGNGCSSGFEAGQLENASFSSPDSAEPDAVEKLEYRDIVVGYGGAARTVLSCDGGLSWTANQYDPTIPADRDISHTDAAAIDLVYSEGSFYRVQGWFGPTGTRVLKSDDGINWIEVLGNSPTFSLAVTGSGFVGGDGAFRYAPFGATTWSVGNILQSPMGQRHNKVGFMPATSGESGVAISIGDSGTGAYRFAFSEDEGRNWNAAAADPTWNCVRRLMVGPNAAISFGGSGGSVCVTKDRGRSWQLASGIPTITNLSINAILWNSEKYRLYRNNAATQSIYESVDGVTWSVGSNLSMPNTIQAQSASRIFYDQSAGLYLGVHTKKFVSSSDGINFQFIDVDNETLAGRDLQYFASGRVLVGESHPCYQQSESL